MYLYKSMGSTETQVREFQSIYPTLNAKQKESLYRAMLLDCDAIDTTAPHLKDAVNYLKDKLCSEPFLGRLSFMIDFHTYDFLKKLVVNSFFLTNDTFVFPQTYVAWKQVFLK